MIALHFEHCVNVFSRVPPRVPLVFRLGGTRVPFDPCAAEQVFRLYP